jgi:hypothetical protein
MILGARIANRTPGAEINGECRPTGRYPGSRVPISPEKSIITGQYSEHISKRESAGKCYSFSVGFFFQE